MDEFIPHIVGDWGNELVFDNESAKFVLMKQDEIKEYEEEVAAAENNLKVAEKKLRSSKNCLDSFIKNYHK